MSCCGALEGNSSPEKDQGTAGNVRGNVEASFGPCQEKSVLPCEEAEARFWQKENHQP